MGSVVSNPSVSSTSNLYPLEDRLWIGVKVTYNSVYFPTVSTRDLAKGAGEALKGLLTTENSVYPTTAVPPDPT